MRSLATIPFCVSGKRSSLLLGTWRSTRMRVIVSDNLLLKDLCLLFLFAVVCRRHRFLRGLWNWILEYLSCIRRVALRDLVVITCPSSTTVMLWARSSWASKPCRRQRSRGRPRRWWGLGRHLNCGGWHRLHVLSRASLGCGLTGDVVRNISKSSSILRKPILLTSCILLPVRCPWFRFA